MTIQLRDLPGLLQDAALIGGCAIIGGFTPGVAVDSVKLAAKVVRLACSDDRDQDPPTDLAA